MPGHTGDTLRYLRGSAASDYILVYPKEDTLTCVGFTDADWERNLTDHGSTSGFDVS
jgi:hypothetical protein